MPQGNAVWRISVCAILLSTAAYCVAQLKSDSTGGPFGFSAAISEVEPGLRILTLSVTVPDGHYLYADRLEVLAAASARLERKSGPAPEEHFDPLSDGVVPVYSGDFQMDFFVRDLNSGDLSVTVFYQGCRADACFMPASKSFRVSELSEESVPSGDPLADLEGGFSELLSGFDVIARKTGYLSQTDFLEFLDSAGSTSQGNGLAGLLQAGSLWLSILGIMLGGLALNLTPCVLPMIPVNIAIIGAGAGAGSRRRGFKLGGLYGLGMTIAYGTAGAVVVLTGAMFGSLNASPWFNLGVAVIFLLLGLAMFDLFAIDFSRFLGASGGKTRGLGVAAIILMGAVAALLAGACVAPVVIFVLLHSASLYAGGARVGLLLPFLLGLGMALPWPLVGGGLSVLPKPGRWMARVKAAFGIIILAAAAYYGFEGAKLMTRAAKQEAHSEELSTPASEENEIWTGSLAEGLARATQEGKPVLIDFWASWCKSCMAMEKSTFKEPSVQKRLRGLVAVKHEVVAPNQSPEKELLDSLEVRGLPTYIILKRSQKPDSESKATSPADEDIQKS